MKEGSTQDDLDNGVLITEEDLKWKISEIIMTEKGYLIRRVKE